jgi:hypothetical protein
MKNFWLFALVLLVFAACKSKRTTLTDDQEVTPAEFIEFFPELKLPYIVADSSLSKKNNDSSIIGNMIVTRMIGDTVLRKQFGANAKPRIYPIGRVPVKRGETYVLIKAIAPTKKAVYLLTFDKRDSFRAALPLLVQDTDPQTTQSAGMDSKYTISITRQRKKPDGTSTYRKEAYIYNDIGVYTLILTESNEEATTAAEIVNPLDTVARKNKYSGDYFKDKRNIISVRDGKGATQMRFFVHFEKDKGTCNGELRGEATFVKPNIAVYRESGDPCVLQFTFTSNAVSMQEVEGCGNYRDIKCFFEGSFPKKKEVKPKPKKK